MVHGHLAPLGLCRIGGVLPAHLCPLLHAVFAVPLCMGAPLDLLAALRPPAVHLAAAAPGELPLAVCARDWLALVLVACRPRLRVLALSRARKPGYAISARQACIKLCPTRPGFHGVWRPAGSRVPAGRAALAVPGAARPGSLPHWAQRGETGLLLPEPCTSRRRPGDGTRGPALCGFVPGRGAIPGHLAGCLPFRTSRRSPSSSSPWRAPR